MEHGLTGRAIGDSYLTAALCGPPRNIIPNEARAHATVVAVRAGLAALNSVYPWIEPRLETLDRVMGDQLFHIAYMLLEERERFDVHRYLKTYEDGESAQRIKDRYLGTKCYTEIVTYFGVSQIDVVRMFCGVVCAVYNSYNCRMDSPAEDMGPVPAYQNDVSVGHAPSAQDIFERVYEQARARTSPDLQADPAIHEIREATTQTLEDLVARIRQRIAVTGSAAARPVEEIRGMVPKKQAAPVERMATSGRLVDRTELMRNVWRALYKAGFVREDPGTYLGIPSDVYVKLDRFMAQGGT